MGNGADARDAMQMAFVSISSQDLGCLEDPYGSAMRRSVSLTIRLGKAMLGDEESGVCVLFEGSYERGDSKVLCAGPRWWM